MRWTIPLWLIGLIVCLGCNKPDEATMRMATPSGGYKDKGNKKDRNEAVNKPERLEHLVSAPEAQVADPKAPPPPPGQDKKAKEQPRKIKYTGDMRVYVDKFDDAVKGLNAAITEAKALRAEESITSSPNSPRVGTWRVRVPLDQFDSFRNAVGKLGAVERNTLQSEDITAKFYDLQAHIKNRQAARETLRELLKEVGKKEMKHYLEVWDKLEKMSDEIDRAEGQLRLWADLTDLTTLTITLHEKQKYIPEEQVKKEEEPTFSMRAEKTWYDSWEALLGFGQGAAIVAIAVTPWLPMPIVLGAVIWLFAGLIRRPPPKTAAPAVVKPVVVPAAEPPPEPKKP